MYFLAVGSLHVVSLYFYCLCLARRRTWLSSPIFSLSLIFPAWPSCFRVLDISVCILLWNSDCFLEVHCFWWTTRETQVGLWQQHAWVLASSFYGLLGASKQFYHVEPAVLRNPGAKFPAGLQILCHTCMSQGRPGSVLQVGLKFLDSFSFSAEILQFAVSSSTEWGCKDPQEHHLLIHGVFPH